MKMGEEKEETLKFTCIVCPIGCELIVKKVGAKIIDIKGYKCPKGKEYAIQEVTNPQRILMTVVKVRGGSLPTVSVKTAKPIPKAKLFEAVKYLSKLELKPPIKIGDVIVDDIVGTGVPIVATRNVNGE